jgi:hypothetical protein
MKDKLKEAILTFQNGKEIILESKKYNFDIDYFQNREEYNIFFRPLYKRMEIFNLKMKRKRIEVHNELVKEAKLEFGKGNLTCLRCHKSSNFKIVEGKRDKKGMLYAKNVGFRFINTLSLKILLIRKLILD